MAACTDTAAAAAVVATAAAVRGGDAVTSDTIKEAMKLARWVADIILVGCFMIFLVAVAIVLTGQAEAVTHAIFEGQIKLLSAMLDMSLRLPQMFVDAMYTPSLWADGWNVTWVGRNMTAPNP